MVSAVLSAEIILLHRDIKEIERLLERFIGQKRRREIETLSNRTEPLLTEVSHKKFK